MNNTRPTCRRVSASGCTYATHKAKLIYSVSRFVFAALALTLTLVLPPPAAAQSPDTGSITGRVQNGATGTYLNNARVSVKGTSIVAFTDDSGTYVVSNVPAGPVTLRVFFTGLDEREIDVTVSAGQTVQSDIKLTNRQRYGETTDEIVRLDDFIVESAKVTDASAIAVNEQRFAANITSVVSTDEFGSMVDKNPGEFLKWLPGVDVEYFANNIVGVSVRGLGSVNTEVNFDGMPMASMNAEGVGRNVDIQYASAADVARVEIRKLPLPEDSSNAIGGIINLIRRSAFEYDERQIGYQVLFQSDGEELTFDEIDGPKDQLRARWRPNWEFKWTEPVSNDLGFAFTVGQNNTVVNTHWAVPGWSFGNRASNAAAEAAIAAGQPVPTNAASLYNPAKSSPLNHNAPLMQGKTYISGRVDWRARPELRLSYGISRTEGWKQVADDIRYSWRNGGSVYNDQFTSLGREGTGGIYHDHPLWRDVDTPTTSHTLEAEWKSGDWEANARGTYSVSEYTYHDIDHGFFNSTSVHNVSGIPNIPSTGVGAGTANPIPITVNFYDMDFYAPQTIEALDADGNPVDWWSNDVIRIGGARSRPGTSRQTLKAAKLYVKRHFGTENPLSIQLGLDFSEDERRRKYDYNAWRFVGEDGIPQSEDDSASLIAADNLNRRPDASYGFPGAERISMTKLYQLYVDHPDWWEFDENRSFQLSATANAAYTLKETTTAPYVQFDWRLMENKLRLTGGVRFEKTKAEARGLLRDNTAAYQKYSDGSVVRSGDVVDDTTGLPTERAGNPVFLDGIEQSSLDWAKLTLKPLGAYAEGSNDGAFPSLHATYNFTDNLVLQLGYARTQAKNRFDRSVIPDNNINDNIQNSGALGRINIRNPDLKPWKGDNFEGRLSYYNNSGGLIGIGAYHKRITDYQQSITTNALTVEELADWGFGPEYEGYEVNTMFNQGTARIQGLEIEARQSLDPFVPDWARGFLVRTSLGWNKLKDQPPGGDFDKLRVKRYTFNVGYRRGRFAATVGYILNGQQHNGLRSSNGYSGERITDEQHMVDFNVEYRINRWARVFFAGNNITDELRVRREEYAQVPHWGQLSISNTFGVTYTAGITGSF